MKPNCLVCGKLLSKYSAKHCKSHRLVSKETKKKYAKRMKGNTLAKGKNLGNTHGFKKGKTSWNKGLGVPWLIGEKHPKWKGNKASYRTIHHWINNHFGSPKICVNCGKDGLTGHKIHWANKSGKYLRNITDWMRLCVSCHKRYDLNKSSQ